MNKTEALMLAHRNIQLLHTNFFYKNSPFKVNLTKDQNSCHGDLQNHPPSALLLYYPYLDLFKGLSLCLQALVSIISCHCKKNTNNQAKLVRPSRVFVRLYHCWTLLRPESLLAFNYLSLASSGARVRTCT